MGSPLKLKAGERFGRLVVLRDATPHRRKNGKHLSAVACRRDCGTEKIMVASHIKTGVVVSCGCYRDETTAARVTKHGLARKGRIHPLFSVWASMIQRCYDSNAQSFPHYGGRGIRVCDRWREDFPAFLADMGPKPTPKHSIDRIDPNGNYEPANCRWATQREQTLNRRMTVTVTAFGLSQPLALWAEQCGLKRGTLAARLRSGWAPERALADWSPWGEAFTA